MKRRKVEGPRAEVEDLYAVLEVTKDADTDTIKQAYRRLALKFHPDRNHGEEQEVCSHRFKQVAAAYDVLSDPEKRSQYDNSLSTKFSSKLGGLGEFFKSAELRKVFEQFVASGSSAFNDGTPHSSSSSPPSSSSFSPPHQSANYASASTFSASAPSSTFYSTSYPGSGTNSSNNIPPFDFTKPRRPKRPLNGQNLRTTLEVSFEESVFGCTKIIELRRLVHCGSCSGLGYPKDAELHACEECEGTGTYSHKSPLLTINSVCSCCDGAGAYTKQLCTYCKGEGRVQDTKELRVEVPAGVMPGMKKIYEQEGDAGEYGGTTGDLIVVFRVATSPDFIREGDDVICKATISFFQAALGGELWVPGLYGQDVRVQIPPGTQPNDVLRIENQGFTSVTTQRKGCMYVRLSLSIPRSLTSHQTQLLRHCQAEWEQLS
ncbi:Molecular chaperone DnaJ [Balamuthia mandrillaris]